MTFRASLQCAIVTVFCAVFSAIGSIVVPPRVHVAAPKVTVAAEDTITGVSATVYDSLGKRQTKARVTWTVRPRGPITITPDTTGYGQHASISGEQVGRAYAIATWRVTEGVFASDSVRITVKPARMVSFSGYWSFHRTEHGIVGDSSRHAEANDGRCPYAVGRDRRGGILTGRKFSLTVADSVKSWIFLQASPSCPDTTVDPARFVP